MWKYKIICIILLVFFNEFLIYRIQKFTWKEIKCTNDENCTRILLVADPQILGNYHENFYARFDSDRHLAHNYKVAVSFVKPNVIIFLGDLMDEGSIASDRQYLDYYERFMKIFPVPGSAMPIYIAGDNDVGGEGGEQVDSRRFKALFGNETFWNVHDVVEVIHFNRIERNFQQLSNNSSKSVRIVVSHFPIMETFDDKMTKALEAVKPHAIFSAHNHKSNLYRGDLQYYKSDFISKEISFILNRLKSLIEIQVPSVNYRMGTLTIGFGQAIIEDEVLHYTPLFIVSRFYQFLVYLVVLKVYLISICCRCTSHFWRKRRRVKYQQLTNVDDVFSS